MIDTLEILATHPAPAGRPMPLTFHDGALWVGCWDTSRLYAIDRTTWLPTEEIQLPGKPYGMASFGGMLHVVVSVGADDDRYIYRCVPGKPLDESVRVACDQFTGSHLATDGTSLFLLQQTLRRMIEIDTEGSVKRAIPFSTRCTGMAFAHGAFYMIAADADFDVLEFATLDFAKERADPSVIAPMNTEARGLAFDGTAWWTCYRELGDIVSFTA